MIKNIAQKGFPLSVYSMFSAFYTNLVLVGVAPPHTYFVYRLSSQFMEVFCFL